MGTKIRIENIGTPTESLHKPCDAQELKVTHMGLELANKCICGCNVPILYAKRNCNIPYSTPRENFRAILTAFFKENLPETIESENHLIDLYDLFHIILKVKSQCGRVSWRRVAKALGVEKSASGFRKPLRRYYRTKLESFEAWLVDKGPVSIGCIDTSLVIIILKEFLPKLEKPAKPDSPQSTFPSPSRLEIHKDVYDLVESLISDIEAGKVLMKKRKVKEELPHFDDPLGCDPIFVIKQRIIKQPKEKKVVKVSAKVESLPKVIELPQVKNPMTNEFRKRDPASMGYRTDFRKGYLPIEMQEEHEKLEKIHIEKESKAHFIRKKQSAVNIKRSCGVTYVKPTESKQKGVTHEFPPLPPLAFQVGTIDRIVPIEERPKFFALASDIISDLFSTGRLLRVTIQLEYSEEDLKKYILGEKSDGEEVFVEDIQGLWRILAKDSFVVIHFNSDPKCLFVPCGPGQVGNCKIGFLVKKGLCGTKSVKKCLGLPDLETDQLNMYATQIRMELYITRELWKSALVDTRKILCSFIGELELFVQKFLVNWNNLRDEVFTTKIIPETELFWKHNKECGCQYSEPKIQMSSFWEYKSNVRPRTPRQCPSCDLPIYAKIRNFQINLPLIMESKNLPNWFYLINTRDSFSYDLKVKKSYIGSGPTRITKKVYYFHKGDLPSNYKDWEKYSEDDYVRTGVVVFKNCFSHSTLLELEKDALKTEEDFLAGKFLKNTAQPTFGSKGKIKRTKFFFGTRYLWTSAQLSEKQSRIAAGVRVDVSATPAWMREKIEKPLVEAGVVEKNFINSIAMNIYHDGKEGLAQHFDDAVRFKQPIYTVKLDSDSRLSFGSQFYGYLNGAFCIPCPRGAVCMLEEFSYAANSVKHCVRPCDLAGRSITIILRQIHPFIMEEAKRFDVEVDLPTWFSTLSLSDDATPYNEQKDMEAKIIIKSGHVPKAGY